MAVKTSSLLRSDGAVGVLVMLAVLLLSLATDVIGTLERRFYDFASTSSTRQPSSQIAVIAIDDQSIANLGRWPWPRDVHARLIDRLTAARAKVVVHTAFFFEPQVDRGLAYIQQIKDVLGPEPDPGETALPQREQLLTLISQAQQQLDTDGQLAASFTKAGNVLIPAVFTLGAPRGRPDAALPSFLQGSLLADPQGLGLPAHQVQLPLAVFGQTAAVGHLNQWQDIDGAVRFEPLLVHYHGQAMPSLALLAAARSLNLTAADIRLVGPQRVQLGQLAIDTDAQSLILPQFYSGQDGRGAFAVDSFFDVLQGKIDSAKYADKIVIIGATATGLGARFAVPGASNLGPAEITAHITSSILSEHFIAQPDWADWALPLILLTVALYAVLGLPRLSAGHAALLTTLLFALLLSAEYVLLSAASLWLKLMLPATLLLTAHLAITTRRFLTTEAGKIKSDEESAETNRMMGLALQGQGQFDMAFDRFRRVPLNDDVMGNLYNLALDFERKRQFNKAQAVYEHMATFNPAYKDLKIKLSRARNLSETVMLGGGAATHPGGTLLLDGGAVEKPMLGRYQVERELGKGAMGVVYQGKDPKIGRVVAIKTMALSNEFEGDELINARERFFREAETAGRLQHQNIVTIFDAGEEQDLAYIAMEFLKGRDLTEFSRPGQLLPVAVVLSIISRVARALAYAHRQQVVHRDIKPANIMYDPTSDTVKVTDFGIARITDSSKTRTGIVLGTPSYMSPEQLSGKKVDGRSDLYSLAVMLFQLLTGVLPLRGESMAELMFKIANEDAPDVRSLRPDLPDALSAVLQRALHKQPEVRYQDGEQLADALAALDSVQRDAPVSEAGAGVPSAVAATPDLAGNTTAATFAKTQQIGELAAARRRPDPTPDLEID